MLFCIMRCLSLIPFKLHPGIPPNVKQVPEILYLVITKNSSSVALFGKSKQLIRQRAAVNHQVDAGNPLAC
ncbi:MAG: hypothetical protein OXD47_05030, partial [Gammaproteobacteria bacterium]|nr:hypothetical protein [Gammaproteobacteria bacterium]